MYVRNNVPAQRYVTGNIQSNTTTGMMKKYAKFDDARIGI